MNIKPHSVCLIVKNYDGKVLSVTRKDNHNDWGLPAGKIEPNETSTQAIIREVKEETGYDLYNYLSLGIYGCLHKGVIEQCELFYGFVKGIKSTKEPHLVDWVDPILITEGTFGDFNKMTLKLLNIEY